MIQQRLEKAMGKKTDAHTHFDGTRTGKDHNWQKSVGSFIIHVFNIFTKSFTSTMNYRTYVSCWIESGTTTSLLVHMAWQIITKKESENGNL